MKLHPRLCPICGSTDRSAVMVESNFHEDRLDRYSFASRKAPELMHYRMVLCSTCDLLYATPAPEAEWLLEAYEDAEFDAAEESRHAARTYSRQLPLLMAQLPDHDGALDIGAGDGAFLECLLTAGFAGVTGVEPSRAPVGRAKREIGKLIREGPFRSEDHEPGSLSLVTCFQVLEHVHEPSTLCIDAFNLLKPGGAFFSISHNYRSVSARILGERSPIYDIEHLQLNSSRSLRFMYACAGFEDVTVKPMVNRYPLSYWVKLAPFQGRLKTALSRHLAALGIDRLIVPAWAGNLMAIGFKPRARDARERT